MDKPSINKELVPRLMRRAKTFNDKEREDFVRNTVKKYANNKNWLTFKWPKLVRFFGLRAALQITKTLGGKWFYPATIEYEDQNRSSDQEKGNRKWMRLNRSDLKELIGEEATKLVYAYLKQTYIKIPAQRLFGTVDYISFGAIQIKTIDRIEEISKLRKEGLANHVIADRLRISQQQLRYYIKRYQL